jgi:copper transport protein
VHEGGRPSRQRRRWRAHGAALGLALVTVSGLVVGTAAPASAHAELISSTPSDGETLQDSPGRLLLRLSESVELAATRVTITDGSGRNIAATSLGLRTSPGASTEEPATLVVRLPHLGTGQYRLSWTTLSSDDLHVTQGVMVFGVGQHVRRAGNLAEPTPSRSESAIRWTGLLGLGLTAGAGLLLLLLGAGRPGTAQATVQRRLLTAALTGAGVALVAGPVLLVSQAAGAAGPLAETLRRSLLHEPYAGWWWARELAVLGLVVVAAICRRHAGYRRIDPRPVAAGAVLATVATTTTVLMGHAGARPQAHLIMVSVESVHVMSALLWAGTVLAAALALSTRVPGEPRLGGLRQLVLRRFGVVAALAVSVSAVTGLLLAGRRLATPDALLGSVYGHVLLVKLGFVAVALFLGLVNTVLLHPELVPRRFRRSPDRRLGHLTVALEAVTVVLLLAATAVLAAAPPATGPRWQPVVRSAGLASGQAHDLVETLRVQPNRAGDNFLSLQVFDTRRPSPGRVESVVVALRGADGRRTSRIATTQGDGSWVVAGQPLSAGSWTARVTAARAGLPDATATFRWTVPDPDGRPVSGWRAQPLRSLAETAALGVLVVLLVVGAALIGVRGRRDPPQPPGRQGVQVDRQLTGTNGLR